MAYRGRFAPSPSGPLHAGSLVAALGSYLDAKAHQGQWYIRVEDIDPPREVQGAADTILHQLEAHSLYWDAEVTYQRNHNEFYEAALEQLWQQQKVYYCNCTRKQIKARAPYYTGFCRHQQRTPHNAAIRLRNDSAVTAFYDRMHGQVTPDHAFTTEDFVLRRRDGLWAYQLAVVTDDMRQGITDIVRGSDLLIPTTWQLTLWQLLKHTQGPWQGANLPRPAHLPLIKDNRGRKLSKQNHAPALNNQTAPQNMFTALGQLGLTPPQSLSRAPCAELLTWAIPIWKQKYMLDDENSAARILIT